MRKPESNNTPRSQEQKNISKGAQKAQDITEEVRGKIRFITKKDWFADTLGHIGAIPTHLFLGTFRNVFQNTPKEEIKEAITEGFKDAPFKNEIAVRLGHSSLFGELKRLYDPHIKGRPNIVLRTLFGIPSVFGAWLMGKIMRSDLYNPFTKTATVFHPNKAVALHETGHALDFDRRYSGAYTMLDELSGLFVLPKEWRASHYAMKALSTPEERQKASKVLEPAFGSYIGGPIGIAVGHITSRLKGKDKNWFFKSHKHTTFEEDRQKNL